MTEKSRVVAGPSGGQITVSLTHHELRQAFDIALARQAQNLANHAKHYDPDTHAGLWQTTKGIVGETAVSLALGVPLYALTSLGDHSAPDVPPNVQVRTTTWADGALHLYRKDNDAHPFVLAFWDVDASLGRVILIGWQIKKPVAREAYWNQGKARWEVPQAELRPLAELSALFAEARALEALERVANYRAAVAERERQARPQSATPAPADSRPADGPAPIEAATPACAPGAITGSPATSDDTSLLERDF